MHFLDERAKIMTIKNVKQHITTYVFDSIIPLKNRSHMELEMLILIPSKIYEITQSFDIKENDYRSLITALFLTDSFISQITETIEYVYPIYIQDVLSSKQNTTLDKETTTLSTTTTILSPSSTSSNVKRSKLKSVRPSFVPNKKQITAFKRKKAKGGEISRIYFFRDYIFNQKNKLIGTCNLGPKCSDSKCVLIGFDSEKCESCELPIHKKCSNLESWVIKEDFYCCYEC